jgi:hypothetical protein
VVRRLHDTGKSGWWIFIMLVPLVGGIWFIVLMCGEGQYGPNRYGVDPKQSVQRFTEREREKSIAVAAIVGAAALLVGYLIQMLTRDWFFEVNRPFPIICSLLSYFCMIMFGAYFYSAGNMLKTAMYRCLAMLFLGSSALLEVFLWVWRFDVFGNLDVWYLLWNVPSMLLWLTLLTFAVMIYLKTDSEVSQETINIVAIALIVLTGINVIFNLYYAYRSPYSPPLWIIIQIAWVLLAVYYMQQKAEYGNSEQEYADRKIDGGQFLDLSETPPQVNIVPKKENTPTPVQNPAPQNRQQRTGFPLYTGSGVCDVCNRPLAGVTAYMVPNSVFYASVVWRTYFKNLHFLGTNRITDADIERMRINDRSPGSAVCENCIHMFQ